MTAAGKFVEGCSLCSHQKTQQNQNLQDYSFLAYSYINRRYTFYTTIYFLYYNTLSILQYTFYTIIYFLYYNILSILQYTFYTTIYFLYYNILSILQYTFYTIIYYLFYRIILALYINSISM